MAKFTWLGSRKRGSKPVLVPGESTSLHRAFLIRLWLKGLGGLTELLGALALLLIPVNVFKDLGQSLSSMFLNANPENAFGLAILKYTQSLDGHSTLLGAIYLVTHGAVKVVLVYALFRNRMWAYPMMLAALVIFVTLQTVDLFNEFTWGVFALTIFDIFMIWITNREWQLHKKRNEHAAAH